VTLITRHHAGERAKSKAVYSDCARYRYSLQRVWARGERRLLIVMLNPSKATEEVNDPTIERCERRTRALGYGAMGIVNLFGWRATHPRDLKRANDPVGPDNAAVLATSAKWADEILCAWGVHGDLMDQGRAMAAHLKRARKPLLALGTTMAGHPRHPLYVSYAVKPVAWNGYSS